MQGIKINDMDVDPSLDPRIELIGEEPDGQVFSVDYSDLPEEEAITEEDFYANLAGRVDPLHLNKIYDEVIQEIEDNESSREQFLQSCAKGIKYLGFESSEEFINSPFQSACGAFDSSMATLLIDCYANVIGELYPSKGPAKLHIFGEYNEQIQYEGQAIIDSINHYLTIVDKDYYPDEFRMLWYAIFFGCGVTKTFIDPVLEAPVSRFILPENFIVDNNAISVTSADYAEKAPYSRKYILEMENKGQFLPSSLPDINDDDEVSELQHQIDRTEGLDREEGDNKNIFDYYLCHKTTRIMGIDEDVDEDIPLPYLLTICKSSRKIVAINRDWREEDPLRKRKEEITIFNFLPGFGIYGVGLIHLCLGDAVVATALLRALVNSGLLNNHAGGIMKKGMLKADQNDVSVQLGSFMQVDTGEMRIQDVFMGMPFNPPSPVLNELRTQIINSTINKVSASQKTISDAVSPNMGQALGLAILDSQSRIQSAVLRSFHMSLGNQLQLLLKLFAENFPSEHTFDVAGRSLTITQDFFKPNVGIVPVSDPDLMTSAQRLMRLDYIRNLAQAYPQLYNLRNLNKLMLEAINFKQIDEVLMPEEQPLPLDPVTENAMLLQGKAVKAFAWQDHDAYIAVRSDPILQQNPQTAALAAANTQEHVALKYLAEMQAKMGITLPNPEIIMQNPEVQNEIAVRAATVTLKQIEEMQAQQQAQMPPSPAETVMMDVEQRREAAQLKFEEAKIRQETEAFKATTNFETEKMKLAAQKEMAEEKNDVALELAQMKEVKERKNLNTIKEE